MATTEIWWPCLGFGGEGLKLTEEKALNIEFGDDVLKDLNYKGDISLVGKVWMERSISKAVTEAMMVKL